MAQHGLFEDPVKTLGREERRKADREQAGRDYRKAQAAEARRGRRSI